MSNTEWGRKEQVTHIHNNLYMLIEKLKSFKQKKQIRIESLKHMSRDIERSSFFISNMNRGSQFSTA